MPAITAGNLEGYVVTVREREGLVALSCRGEGGGEYEQKDM